MQRKGLALQIVPKYPELSVDKVWSFVKKNKELISYFPDYSENQLPERDFMLAVIGTLKPAILKTLVCQSRAMRSVKNKPNDDEFIEMRAEVKMEIMNVVPQKVKYIHLYHWKF